VAAQFDELVALAHHDADRLARFRFGGFLFLLAVVRRLQHLDVHRPQAFFEEPLDLDATADFEVAERLQRFLLETAALGRRAAEQAFSETSASAKLLAVRRQERIMRDGISRLAP